MKHPPISTKEALGLDNPGPSAKRRGAMIYLDKSTPVLVQMSPEQYNQFKKTSCRIGQQSILRHQTPNGGKLT